MPQESPRQGVVAVVKQDAFLLVIRRSQAVVAPGAFCFPGGGIHTGETAAEAVRREFEEELGVAVHPCRELWRSTTAWNVQLAWWQVELATHGCLRPNPDEVETFRWLKVPQIRELPELLSSNHAFLDAWQRGEFALD